MTINTLSEDLLGFEIIVGVRRTDTYNPFIEFRRVEDDITVTEILDTNLYPYPLPPYFTKDGIYFKDNDTIIKAMVKKLINTDVDSDTLDNAINTLTQEIRQGAWWKKVVIIYA